MTKLYQFFFIALVVGKCSSEGPEDILKTSISSIDTYEDTVNSDTASRKWDLQRNSIAVDNNRQHIFYYYMYIHSRSAFTYSDHPIEAHHPTLHSEVQGFLCLEICSATQKLLIWSVTKKITVTA